LADFSLLDDPDSSSTAINRHQPPLSASPSAFAFLVVLAGFLALVSFPIKKHGTVY
jgi:hypothetical protein